jgi:plastocyanin
MLIRGQALSPSPTSGKARYPALSILDRALILAIAVAQFLIGHGRVWAKPFDWDRSIIWSYATIAALVLLVLLLRRRFTPVAWLLHAVELMSFKFLLTASFLVGFLITHPPGSVPLPERSRQPATASQTKAQTKPSPKPTPLQESSRGHIQGMVIGNDRRGVSGALVFVSEGLNRFVFEPPAEAVIIENDGTRFSPAVSAVQTGQPLVVRSANHELHTVQMMKHDRSWVMNVPVLASGEGRQLKFDDAKGLVSIECKVHQARESPGHLAILSHPFFALTDSEGRFVLHGVPAAKVTISVFDAGKREVSQPVQLEPGAKVNLTLQLGRT